MIRPNNTIHRGWNRRLVTGKTLEECDEKLANYLNEQDYGSGEFTVLHENDGNNQNTGYKLPDGDICYISFMIYNSRL
ncbi:hypothetical protein DY120_01360 [Apilactobacillus micheneri]|uniref:Uncharacterized protein n=1 Tax=Apilactobacillus micheneri TaxID=1899430 RepID=A0ABY2YZ32_9LACO|nr:hypothetical protein [Apilactobacillus micheneri]TPR26370.1 hypothetical protein DY114_01360 [Apilactobacillus micheneri]TPR27124.1 hypothetical protein DY111_01360 [Apilactobacillus micheneri]TPR27372.1 hypothetical protein DY113_06310 [Apilactobacillus micheneri]TPR31887.1 hypothetical protein DY117_01360 [Apilactobacillus micheneri]TPR32291.1 hypothetical protein DY120_01360 [Apilactobacillus micheneri]